jgi:signal transduction histidine kinase
VPQAAAPNDDYLRTRAAETRLEMLVAGLTAAVVMGSAIYIYTLFAPISPPSRLLPWLIYNLAVAAFMGGAPVVILARRPGDAEVLRLWSRLGMVFAILLDLGTAASVWLLLPYASEQLRFVMVVLYSALITGQLATQADSPGVTAFGVAIVFGSTALFFWSAGGQYSRSLAAFLLAFGGLIVSMAFVLKNAIRSAIRSRIQAERASQDLAVALDAVSAAQTAKSRFIAAATHDLRQPLQATALFFDQAVKGRTAAARRKAADGCRLALSEANAILIALLDHLRLDAGGVRPKLQPVCAGELFERLALEMAPAAALQDVDLVAAKTDLAVTADPDLAIRVLRNFVANALRHSRCRRILLGVRRRAGRGRLYVIDDGVGVPADDAEALFDEYAQGARVRERGLGGMGLGLASARRLAELMEGRAELDPAWRGGAAFFIELPRADSDLNAEWLSRVAEPAGRFGHSDASQRA